MSKFDVTVTKIGEMALDFLEEKMLVIFNENAPPELAEISLLHTISELESDVVVGDKVELAGKPYVVTAVGYEANHTLKSLGHCTISFKPFDEPEMPGTIHLSGDDDLTFKIGDKIVIH